MLSVCQVGELTTAPGRHRPVRPILSLPANWHNQVNLVLVIVLVLFLILFLVLFLVLSLPANWQNQVNLGLDAVESSSGI